MKKFITVFFGVLGALFPLIITVILGAILGAIVTVIFIHNAGILDFAMLSIDALQACMESYGYEDASLCEVIAVPTGESQ